MTLEKGIDTVKSKRHIMVFLAHAFSVPLTCVLLMKYVPGFGEGNIQLILYGIQGASPAIAAILSVLNRDGGKGLKEFLYSNYVAGFSLKIATVGFFLPAIILTVAKSLTYLTPYQNQFLTIPDTKKIIILLWALIAEELGWRGYLQKEIEERVGENLTPLLIGIIWSAWHYHFFLSGSMDVPALPFIYGCIAESYGYYMITKWAKGNIIPASLWHFSGNLFFNLYLLNPNWNEGSSVPYIIANSLMTVFIIVFYIQVAKKSKGEKSL